MLKPHLEYHPQLQTKMLRVGRVSYRRLLTVIYLIFHQYLTVLINVAL